jgi:hypothetical protein
LIVKKGEENILIGLSKGIEQMLLKAGSKASLFNTFTITINIFLLLALAIS